MKSSLVPRASGPCWRLSDFCKSHFSGIRTSFARAGGPWYGAAFLVFVLSGCAPYAQVQMALVDQSRKGIENARATQASYAAAVDQLHALQRQRLDEAFDADARATAKLDAQWVIDARRVYAAAIDAMDERHFAARQSAAVAQQNLDAIDLALQRLKWLQSVPLSWFEQAK